MNALPVAALERQGRAVLAALGESRKGRFQIVTEDRKRFWYPAERLLWRATALTVPDGPVRDVAAALRVLRAGAGPAPDWEDLRVIAERDVPLDPGALVAEGAGEDADRRALGAVLGAGEAGPWFRFDHGAFVAPADEVVARERARFEAEERARASQAVLVTALRDGAGRMDLPEEARAALEPLVAWALGPLDAPPSAVAKQLGFHDPCDALERLGSAGLLPDGAVPSLTRRGIPTRWSPRAREAAEAAALAPDPASGTREDLTGLDAWAIDDARTTEVDDALSYTTGDDGEPRLWVHIADVAAAITPDDPLDREARRRATSIYLPERTIPMLPKAIVSGRLSLEAGVPREAVSACLRLDADGRPVLERWVRSRVRVTRRLDYASTDDPSGFPEGLRPLHDLARRMRAARRADGAVVLEQPGSQIKVRDGVPVVEVRDPSGAGHVVVGEAMVAYNRLVAATLREAGAAALWRAQDPPRAEEPDPESPLAMLLARRRFSPARIATGPEPHAGLGLECYVQATSPIRRWSDLLHQRQLLAVLEDAPPPYGAEGVRDLAAGLHQRERDVRAAEREREDEWLARLLDGLRDRVFDAWCSRPPQRGRGFAWFPDLLMERPFRWPPDEPRPTEGQPLRLRPGRLEPYRGRVEFARADA